MMQRKWLPLFLVFFLSLLASKLPLLQAQDGIPDNCENQRGEFYRQSLFPRYEPQNQRLVLVDWSTGADAMVLGENLADTRILGWSVDCRYLATAIGSLQSMDTVVWDTVNGGQMGRVTDAHERPHHITWGPGNYLVVETRNGAILWNVGANTQVTLTTAFDTLSGRNFSRLRWNTTHNQLTANLAIGGRVVYDLTTGQETVALPAENDPVQTVPENAIVIGGHPYECYLSGGQSIGDYDFYPRQISNGYYSHSAHVSYDVNSEVLYLEIIGYRVGEGSAQVLEDDLTLSYIRSQGWSSNCRYVAVSVQHADTGLFDTIIWDIVENRRIGAFEGAHQIPHPIHWGPQQSLVIETREGAFLWHVPTNSRILLTDYVVTALSGQPSIESFSEIEWDETTGNLRAILLDDPQHVSVFDGRTGELLETTPVENTLLHYSRNYPEDMVIGQVVITPLQGISGITFRDISYLYPRYYAQGSVICNGLAPFYNTITRELSIRNGDARSTLNPDANAIYRMMWSPDCRYLGIEEAYVDRSLSYDDSPTDDSYSYQRGVTIRFFSAETGQQVSEIEHPYRGYSYSSIWWSPNYERVLVRSNTGYYLVNLLTGDTVLLTFNPNFDYSWIHNYTRAYWDYERGQVLVSGSGGVYAFDMVTGIERYRVRAASHFTVDDNNQILFGGNSIYDLDTLDYTVVDVDLPNYSFTGNFSALSPDGRYLVMARNMIRVWDLTNLPEELNDRDPIYRHHGPDARIQRVRFVDNITIETTSARGVQYWNVETGEEVFGE